MQPDYPLLLVHLYGTKSKSGQQLPEGCNASSAQRRLSVNSVIVHVAQVILPSIVIVIMHIRARSCGHEGHHSMKLAALLVDTRLVEKPRIKMIDDVVGGGKGRQGAGRKGLDEVQHVYTAIVLQSQQGTQMKTGISVEVSWDVKNKIMDEQPIDLASSPRSSAVERS